MVDPKITGEFAKRFVMGEDLGSIKESYRIYAAKYPNAWGMIYLQIPFFALWKLFTGDVSIYAGQTFNVILIQLSVIMTFLTGERIFKLNSQRLFAALFRHLCLLCFCIRRFSFWHSRHDICKLYSLFSDPCGERKIQNQKRCLCSYSKPFYRTWKHCQGKHCSNADFSDDIFVLKMGVKGELSWALRLLCCLLACQRRHTMAVLLWVSLMKNGRQISFPCYTLDNDEP